MKRFLLLAILFWIVSCKTETNKTQKANQEIKTVKRFNFRITVDIWNGFFGYESKFILNNLRIGSYDSIDVQTPLTKPLTLYHISFQSHQDTKNQNIRMLVPIDTTEIVFSKDLSDTLFILTKDFFESVEFNNYDTVGRTIPVITDDGHGTVELSYNGKKLSATITSISNPTIATKQLDTLLHFINKFQPPSKE